MKYTETIKTIALAAIIAGVISFVAGVRYEQSNTKRIEATAKALQAPVVEAAPSK